MEARPQAAPGTKLTVNTPGDMHEQEAERVSEQVMRMPSGTAESTHAGATCAGHGEAPPIVHETLHSPGQPLDTATREFMEPRFGRDFSGVRVHTGTQAAESARAVGARAYTVQNNLVFSEGSFAPGTGEGQRLIAHELTHVVQQGGAAGAAQLQRQPSKQDEEQKKAALKRHEDQQRNVAALLDDARKIKRDPSKGPFDADNLFSNTVEMIDAKRILLSVLSPTHDTTTRKPPQLAYFDWHVRYPKTGGDYPADRTITDTDKGLSFADSDVSGETLAIRLNVPGFVSVFTTDSLIDKDALKKVLVHEAQHVADLHGPRQDDPQLQDPAQGGRKLEDWERALESYKTEFRAHWIQPVPPPVCSGGICLAEPTINRLAAPGEKAENKDPVEVTPADCTVCPEPKATGKDAKPAPAKVKTHLKEKRQEQIFQYLISHYKQQQFACCYVYNPGFRAEVDKFYRPEGVNVINSARLMALTIELESMKPAMLRSEVEKLQFIDAMKKLDAMDWAFLRGDMAAPFWELLKRAPAPLMNAVKDLAKKANASADDISLALDNAMTKLN
jgi:hypothetical protein